MRKRLLPSFLLIGLFASCADQKKAESDYPFAQPIPNHPGYVYSPYNGKAVDTKGLPKGTLVSDPYYAVKEKKYFRTPSDSGGGTGSSSSGALASSGEVLSGVGGVLSDLVGGAAKMAATDTDTQDFIHAAANKDAAGMQQSSLRMNLKAAANH